MYNALRRYKTLIFSSADVLIGASSMIIAFWLRFDGVIPTDYYGGMPLFCMLIAALNFFFLYRANLYTFRWDYVSLAELGQLFKALLFSHLLFAIAVLLGNDFPTAFVGFPRSAILLSFILNFVGIGGLRISKRIYKEILRPFRGTGSARTLIVGTGREAEAMVRSLRVHKEQPYRVIGFIETNVHLLPVRIHGLPVIGALNDLEELVEKYDCEALIIALGSADRALIRNAIERARVAGVTNIKIIPDNYELITQSEGYLSLREVQPEDLLGRQPAKLDTSRMLEKFANKVVMVTGAAGSIGAELVRQLVNFKPRHIIAYDTNESGLFDLDASLHESVRSGQLVSIVGSVTNASKIRGVLEKFRPDCIFHAAAYKHVPFMEQYPEEAIETNIIGTYTLAHAALTAEVGSFVLVSTDKAINPLSVMGKTKRAAELIVQSLNAAGKTSFIGVRFGNVLGSRGSVVPLFQDLIRRRLPLTVTHPEMTRYFMTIREAALLVLEAGAVGSGGEIFMLDMGKPIRILDLAYDLIRLSGLEPDKDIPVVFTQPRPGEKIHEELFSEEEKRIGATEWEKIHVTQATTTTEHARLKNHIETFTATLGREHRSLELVELLDTFIRHK